MPGQTEEGLGYFVAGVGDTIVLAGSGLGDVLGERLITDGWGAEGILILVSGRPFSFLRTGGLTKSTVCPAFRKVTAPRVARAPPRLCPVRTIR